MKKKIRVTEQELVDIIKENINESNFMYAHRERDELVQDVLDRALEYEDEYINALKEFNSNFEVTKHRRIEPGDIDLPKGVKVKSTYRPDR
jgi:hypothetical protein